MGYTAAYFGKMSINPPLNDAEVAHLQEFLDATPDCQWVLADDGTAITWEEDEKFENGGVWLQYLIDRFFTGADKAFRDEPAAAGFTFNHRCHGLFLVDGEAYGHIGEITITDNEVTYRDLVDKHGYLTTERTPAP